MIVIPKENPIIENMNSYYVQIERLIEHYQGEVGCGGLYFKSMSSEGIIFFDKDEVLNGLFLKKEDRTKGKEAVDRLIKSSEATNYALSVYILRPEDIYFWSTIPDAQKIYQDLSTEFTDLEGLIKKMKSEGLTGFIEVFINDKTGGGLIFFNSGQIAGGSYSWGNGDTLRDVEDQKKLIQLTKDHGGSFHVSRIPLNKDELVEDDEMELDAEEVSDKPSKRILVAMEEMIAIFERTVRGTKTVDTDFATLLRRKFVEKADRYPFLDPFAAEFKYADEKLTFDGSTTDGELTKGVMESIAELSEELNATDRFKSNLATWMKKYKEEVETFGIKF